MLSRSIHFFHQWKSFLFYDWLIFHCVCVTFFNPHICRWIVVVVFHSLSHVRLCVTPSTAACQAPLSFTISWSLLKLMCIESVMPSSHLTFCHLLFLLPSIFPSLRWVLRLFLSWLLWMMLQWTREWRYPIPDPLSLEFNLEVGLLLNHFTFPQRMWIPKVPLSPRSCQQLLSLVFLSFW